MSDENKFVSGLYFKEKHPNAPDFVIGGLSAKRQDLIDYLQKSDDEWLNWQIKKSKAGKPYIEVDTWKPKQDESTPQDTGKSNSPDNTTPAF